LSAEGVCAAQTELTSVSANNREVGVFRAAQASRVQVWSPLGRLQISD
jgi:hypothetical protein